MNIAIAYYNDHNIKLIQVPLWSCGSWISNNLCNQCISPLKVWVRIQLIVRCTRYNIM